MSDLFEEHSEAMTDEEFDSFLETLAKLVESSAASGKDAARIIREAKTTAQK